jgi:hypothetical protein
MPAVRGLGVVGVQVQDVPPPAAAPAAWQRDVGGERDPEDDERRRERAEYVQGRLQKMIDTPALAPPPAAAATASAGQQRPWLHRCARPAPASGCPTLRVLYARLSNDGRRHWIEKKEHVEFSGTFVH